MRRCAHWTRRSTASSRSGAGCSRGRNRSGEMSRVPDAAADAARGVRPAPAGPARPRRRRPLMPGDAGGAGASALVFLGPALFLIGVFFLLPVLAAFLLSFTDFDIYAIADLRNTRFVGLRNYAELLRMPLFWTALKNTFYFALVGGPLTIAASLGAALLVNHRLVRFKTLFRTVYFLPFVTTLVAVALVWRYLYHTRYGLLNYGLGWLGLGPVDWLGNPRWAMPAIILMATWKNFGYNMLIFIAGLQAIPDSLYEAARIDGAGAWQRFRHITLPQLGPTTFFVCVITMIGYLQLFVEPYVMTGGGPLRSTTS